MSHFAVLVIGEDVEEQLDPYDENMETEPYREVWDDDEIKRFQEHFGISVSALSVRDMLVKMKEWNGCTNEYDADEDEYYRISTYNPESKWDWYVVGGRWTGFFKVKEGRKAALKGELAAEGKDMLGRPGVFDNAPEHDADVIRKGDVDFDSMREVAAVEAHAVYDGYEEAIKGIDLEAYWPWSKFRIEIEAGEMDIDEARTRYLEQEYVKALREVDLMPWMGEPEEVFGGDRAAYVLRVVNSVAVPYAVVKDGEWISKGRMGWWGMSDDDLTEDQWNEQVWELYNSLPDDTIFTLVDCHI